MILGEPISPSSVESALDAMFPVSLVLIGVMIASAALELVHILRHYRPQARLIRTLLPILAHASGFSERARECGADHLVIDILPGNMGANPRIEPHILPGAGHYCRLSLSLHGRPNPVHDPETPTEQRCVDILAFTLREIICRAHGAPPAYFTRECWVGLDLREPISHHKMLEAHEGLVGLCRDLDCDERVWWCVREIPGLLRTVKIPRHSC